MPKQIRAKNSSAGDSVTDKPNRGIKNKITAMLDLPKEIVFNLPIITMIGSEDINISNYKGIIEYNSELIRISAGQGVIRLEGARLVLKQITSDGVAISGRIKKIEFMA